MPNKILLSTCKPKNIHGSRHMLYAYFFGGRCPISVHYRYSSGRNYFRKSIVSHYMHESA